MVRIAVVNSSSFAKVFPAQAKRLARLGQVKRFMVPADINGATLGRLLRGFSFVVASVNPDYPRAFFEAQGGGLRLLARHGIGK